MKKFSLLVIVLFFSLVGIVHADSNGVWLDAKDIRVGEFGSDENENTEEHFSFNTLGINNQLQVKGNENSLQIIGKNHSYIEFYPNGKSSGRQAWLGFGEAEDSSLSIQDNSNVLINPFGGFVGVGTENPQSQLDVAGGVRANKGDSVVADASNVGYSFEDDGDTGMFAVGGNNVLNSDLHFKIDNISKLILKDEGKVEVPYSISSSDSGNVVATKQYVDSKTSVDNSGKKRIFKGSSCPGGWTKTDTYWSAVTGDGCGGCSIDSQWSSNQPSCSYEVCTARSKGGCYQYDTKTCQAEEIAMVECRKN